MRKWLAGSLIRLAHRIYPPKVTRRPGALSTEAITRMFSEMVADSGQQWHVKAAAHNDGGPEHG